MDVGTVSNARVQLQVPPAGTGSVKKVASNLHEVPVSPGTKASASWEDVVNAVENNRTVQLQYDKEINRVVVQVVDGQTQKVIFQIPSEELVNFMKRFGNYLKLVKEGV